MCHTQMARICMQNFTAVHYGTNEQTIQQDYRHVLCCFSALCLTDFLELALMVPINADVSQNSLGLTIL